MQEMNQSERIVKNAYGTWFSKAKAIRYKCLDCCCYQPQEVKLCTCTTCPLYRYRLGHEEKDELYYKHKEETKGNFYKNIEALKGVD